MIEQLRSIWAPDKLPTDLNRPARNVLALLQSINYSADKLQELVGQEQRRLGMLPNNLSPYAIVLQAISRTEETKLKQALSKKRITLLIHDGMDLPEWLVEEQKCVIRI